MESKNLLVFVATALVLVASIAASVSAFAGISSVEVSGIDALNGGSVAAFAGETLPVRVIFQATDYAEDVRVKVWIAGEKDLAVSSERFDVIQGRLYSRLVNVKVPESIDINEDMNLMVSVENRAEGQVAEASVVISAQRDAYSMGVLDVTMANTVQAGSSLSADVVVKNDGRHLAEDTFVSVSIPALGISNKVYVGDLSAVDEKIENGNDDAVEGTVSLKIPTNAPNGVYVVEFEAYNSDSVVKETRNVAVVGAGEDTSVVASSNAKTFAAGEKAIYSLTLVNTGDSVRVYGLSFEAADGLTVGADESVLVIPAGSSKTVSVGVVAAKSGDYNFAVNVNSNDELVQKIQFSANVEGKSSAGNAAVLLTVILAIIFVVLLVVLVILLTRKPEKTEEIGESYY